MKVLMLSTDASILRDGTPARERMLKYGKLFEELHVVILSKWTSKVRRPTAEISGNVFVYASNAKFRPYIFWKAYILGKQIIGSRTSATHQFVISAQDPFEVGLVGYFLKRRFGIPLQVQVHVDFLSPYFKAESLKNKIRVWIAKFILPKADGVRVVSERIKRSLSSVLGHRSSEAIVLPIFVDVNKISAATPSFNLHEKYPAYDFIILMASRLTREKNIALAIGAMREVAAKHPKALLLIVGEGPCWRDLQLIASSLRLNSNIAFEPWTNDLAPYYKGADLFLSTSNYEGYGRTIIEAMSAGLPVVSTDVGIAGDILVNEESGVVADVGAVNDLARVILKFAHDSNYRKAIADTGFKRAQSMMSEEEYLRRYKNALEDIFHVTLT